MMSVIESNVMVNPLNDSNNFKRIEADNRLCIMKTNNRSKLPVGEADHVSLSEASKQMAALKELILNAPDDKGRIEFVKEKLANGQYQIKDKHIAARMFAELEMA